MQVAQRTTQFRESVIRRMTRLAIEHEAINLSQGFPDFDTPPALKEAAAKAIMDGNNQYSPTWGIAPTNAQGEQEIRPAVVVRKISAGNRSDTGAQTHSVLTSVIRTCRKQGQSFLKLAIERLRNPASCLAGLAGPVAPRSDARDMPSGGQTSSYRSTRIERGPRAGAKTVPL